MKITKKDILAILGTILLFALLFGSLFYLIESREGTASPETGSEFHSEVMTETESETETQSEETEDTEEATEESTEVVVLPDRTPISYNEQIALEYVEKPVIRNGEEALAELKRQSRWYPALYFVCEKSDEIAEGLLISGAGNPEMVEYLYEFFTADDSVTGGFTEEEQPEDYPLFLQFDPRWGYYKYGYNMGCSGCGPTCLSMAVFYLTGDRTCTPDVVGDYGMNNNHYVWDVGTAWTLLTAYPAEHGLTSYQLYNNEAYFKAELDKGRVLICSVRPGNFTSGGHFIVIYGYDENGFKINDPKCVYRSRQSWTYEQIKGDIKATWTIGK